MYIVVHLCIADAPARRNVSHAFHTVCSLYILYSVLFIVCTVVQCPRNKHEKQHEKEEKANTQIQKLIIRFHYIFHTPEASMAMFMKNDTDDIVATAATLLMI